MPCLLHLLADLTAVELCVQLIPTKVDAQPHAFFLQISRLLSCAYCSALLQAVTAATEDLQDMYNAQLSCIWEAHPGKGEYCLVTLSWLWCCCRYFSCTATEELQDTCNAQLSCVRKVHPGKGEFCLVTVLVVVCCCGCLLCTATEEKQDMCNTQLSCVREAYPGKGERPQS